MKTIRLLHTSILGLLGGVVGWTLLQSGFNISVALSTTVFPEYNFFLFNKINYEGALIGLGLGMILQARASLLHHHDLMRILFKMFIGAISGTIIGLVCFGFGNFLQTVHISPLVSRITSWTLLGLSITGASQLFCSASGFLGPRILSGAAGGLIGGGIFEILLQYQLTGPEHLVGLVLSGFCIFLIIGITENSVTSFALRVLTGSQEGQIFLLDQNRFTLGYSSQNDFTLRGYAEVCELHAHIFKNGNQIYIESADAGGDVLVNYRLVDQQSMKKGDVIKIGTALLQYYEIL